MRYIIILITTLLVTSAASSQTQPTASSGTYGNIFKISAARFARNTFQLGYERYFGPTTSLLINTGMNYRESEYEQLWGVGVEAQLKFHVYSLIKPKNSNSLYFAPYLMNQYEEIKKYQWVSSYNQWDSDSFNAVHVGVVFGWSFSFANRINLDMFLGGGIRKTFNTDFDYYDNIWDYSYNGIAPRLGIDVGFWF